MEKETVQRINDILKKINSNDKDRDSLNELHSLVGATLRYIALKYLRNDIEADDLVQDFWADIHQIAAKFVLFQNGFSYLNKVMENRAINRYRKLKRERKIFVSFVDYKNINDAQENSQDSFLDQYEVHNAMEKLSPTEGIIIQLVYFEDKSVREIARELRMSKTKVGKMKIDAIEKLKKEIEDFRDKSDSRFVIV